VAGFLNTNGEQPLVNNAIRSRPPNARGRGNRGSLIIFAGVGVVSGASVRNAIELANLGHAFRQMRSLLCSWKNVHD
jgi:hypothetical protein